MITVKLKLINTIDITDFQRQYNNVVRYAYNRFKEGKDLTPIVHLCKTLNNILNMDRSWINSAVSKAQGLYLAQPDETVVFGGKTLFEKRAKGKISEEE